MPDVELREVLISDEIRIEEIKQSGFVYVGDIRVIDAFHDRISGISGILLNPTYFGDKYNTDIAIIADNQGLNIYGVFSDTVDVRKYVVDGNEIEKYDVLYVLKQFSEGSVKHIRSKINQNFFEKSNSLITDMFVSGMSVVSCYEKIINGF